MFFRVQVFPGPGPGSGSRVRVQGPGSESRVRVQGPGSRVQGPGSGSSVRVQVLEVALFYVITVIKVRYLLLTVTSKYLRHSFKTE